jgi:predicted ATP-grasp superfamily ATP-dependent carboligase
VLPSVAREPAAFAKALGELLAAWPGALLLPMSEMTLGTLYAARLPERAHVAAPPEPAYRFATDKPALLAEARACGFAIPRGCVLAAGRGPDDVPGDLRFPLVAKPAHSCWLEGGRWRRGGARRVDSPAALAAARREIGGPALLVQEHVPGRGEGLSFLRCGGKTVARFAHRRLREKPPSGGVATLAESAPLEPDLCEAADRLLDRIGYEGVGMLEVRRTPEGRAVLMELNPRFWGSLALAIAAGVDFPRLAVAAARGEPLPPPAPRPARVRWLLGDLDHVLLARREGRGRAALRAFARSFADGTRTDVLRRDDLRPFLRELAAWLRGREPRL